MSVKMDITWLSIPWRISYEMNDGMLLLNVWRSSNQYRGNVEG